MFRLMPCSSITGVRPLVWVVLSVVLLVSSGEAQTANGVPRWTGDRGVSTIVPDISGRGYAGGPGFAMVPDDQGGVYVVWDELQYGQIFAQRLDGDGRPLWPVGGLAVASGSWYHMSPRAVSDGAGGLVVLWSDGRRGWCTPSRQDHCSLYVQRLDPNGVELWQPGGVPLATDLDSPRLFSETPIVADGTGGMIAIWGDWRVRCCRAYAQRVRGDGSVAWALDGIAVTPPPDHVWGPMDLPEVVSDGLGGAIFEWFDNQNPDAQSRATVQRLDPDGRLVWGSGVVLDPQPVRDGTIAADGSGGALVVWGQGSPPVDPGRWGHLAAQRVSSSGTLQWGARGVPVATFLSWYQAPDILSDETGGAFVVWQEQSPGADAPTKLDIFAQRITAGGDPAWGGRGVPVSVVHNDQYGARLVADGEGGVLAVWLDRRFSSSADQARWVSGRDVYAQRLAPDGRVLWVPNGTPVSLQRGEQGYEYGAVAERSGIVVLPDGEAGAFVAFVDDRGYDRPLGGSLTPLKDMFVQRIGEAPAAGPVLSGVDLDVRAGDAFALYGAGFTPGSVVNLFVSTAGGVVNVGPLVPISRGTGRLDVAVPASVPLGQGVGSVQVVNTDQHYLASNAATVLLRGSASAGIPSITGLRSTEGIAVSSLDPAVGLAHQYGHIRLGDVMEITGTGFDTLNGVAVDIFCSCPGGKVGPFFVNPGFPPLLYANRVVLMVPESGPLSPAIGPASVVVYNRGTDGLFLRKSNAVAIASGEEVSVTGVAQSGETVTVTGTGFSPATVINLFNARGAETANLGGFDPGGAPRIRLAFVDAHHFTFEVPPGAVPGPAFVEAINPPYVASSTSGPTPAGGFTLY